MTTHWARQLRKDSTDAEQLLWSQLRNRQLGGFKFRRPYSIGGFIVDFVCFEEGLAIEIDGGQHQSDAEYDARRSAKLEELGYRVIRFWNNQALLEVESVKQAIYTELLSPSGTPSP